MFSKRKIFGQLLVFSVLVIAAMIIKPSHAAADVQNPTTKALGDVRALQKASGCGQGTNSTWGVTLNVGVKIWDKNGNYRGMAQNFRFNVAVFTPSYSNYGGGNGVGYGAPPAPPGILANLGGVNADNPRWIAGDFRAHGGNTMDCGFGTHFFKFDELSGSDKFALDCFFNPTDYPGFNGDGFAITGLGVDDPGWAQGHFTNGYVQISSGNPLQDLNLQDFQVILDYQENSDGIIQTAKYFPETSPPNNFSVPPEIAAEGVCLTNKNNVTFVCSASNPFKSGPIWVSDNNYRVSVDVPVGYRINRTNRGSPSCSGANNTVRCEVTITVQGNGITDFVDFWFESLVLPACGNISTDPNDVEPGQQFNINISANATQLAPRDIPFTLDLSMPGIFPGTRTLSGTIPSGQSSGTVAIGPYNKPLGTYTGTYTIRFPGGYAAGPCERSFSIAAHPFFSVRDGDIASGFNGSCDASSGWRVNTSANPSHLVGWSDWPGSNKGAGTNLAIFALSKIDGVTSNQNATSNPLPLTFSNAAKAGSFGGVYGGTLDCPKDYFKQHAGLPTIVAPSTGVPTSDAQHTGKLTLTGGLLGGGTRSALYVDNDVFISGNITLSNGGVTTPGLLSNFYLVVKGNIYISPDVTQLDGVYIAQGSAPASGKIYTCGQANFTPPTAAMAISNGAGGCRRSKLLVNGALIADKINFYRSSGTLFQNDPSEIVTYTPATWLALPKSIKPLFLGGDGTPTGAGYDSITTLQPVL